MDSDGSRDNFFPIIPIEEQNYYGAYHEGFYEFRQFLKLMLRGGEALIYRASLCIFFLKNKNFVGDNNFIIIFLKIACLES